MSSFEDCLLQTYRLYLFIIQSGAFGSDAFEIDSIFEGEGVGGFDSVRGNRKFSKHCYLVC